MKKAKVDDVVKELDTINLAEIFGKNGVNDIGKITNSLPVMPTQSFSDLVRLTNENRQLREENAQLQRQLVDLDKSRRRLGQRSEMLVNMLNALLQEEET